jgi:hypothetical protein
MRNLALMWVLAACLLGCGGKPSDATFTDSRDGKIAQKSKQNMHDKERLEKEERRKGTYDFHYKSLIENISSDGTVMCPERFFMLRCGCLEKKVESAHLQKMDSVHQRKIERKGLFSSDSINSRSFQQKLRTLYGLQDDNRNIDSATALKIAAVAAAECYGSKTTPFVARLMGNNKEHWMVYCFPTIPDNIEGQRYCYEIQKQTYEQGRRFTDINGHSYCPVVFSVLISRENGRVLAFRVP